MSRRDLSEVICALLAIRLGSINFGLSLPHAANGRYKAMISCDPVPGVGRLLPDADTMPAQPNRVDPLLPMMTGSLQEMDR